MERPGGAKESGGQNKKDAGKAKAFLRPCAVKGGKVGHSWLFSHSTECHRHSNALEAP
mgnify:CR=1 FL=1